MAVDSGGAMLLDMLVFAKRVRLALPVCTTRRRWNCLAEHKINKFSL